MSRPFTIRDFRGLDNRHAPEVLAEFDQRTREAGTYLLEATNVDFLRTGGARTRKGWSLAQAGEHHSLWQAPFSGDTFVVRGSTLGTLSEDLVFSTLAEVSQRRLTYADAEGLIFISDGQSAWSYDGAMKTLERFGDYEIQERTALNAGEGQFDAPPPAELYAWVFGRLWAATPEAVYYSQSFRPERFNLEKDFLPIENATLLAGVADGIYIGNRTEVFFLAGGNPAGPQRTQKVSRHGAFPGAFGLFKGSFFVDELPGDVVAWVSAEGKMLGRSGGTVTALTEQRFSFPKDAQAGALFMREDSGEAHLISSLLGAKQEGSNFRASDTADAQIIRNGVVIT